MNGLNIKTYYRVKEHFKVHKCNSTHNKLLGEIQILKYKIYSPVDHTNLTYKWLFSFRSWCLRIHVMMQTIGWIVTGCAVRAWLGNWSWCVACCRSEYRISTCYLQQVNIIIMSSISSTVLISEAENKHHPIILAPIFANHCNVRPCDHDVNHTDIHNKLYQILVQWSFQITI